ncbi:hypothetical protein [Corallococcus sp. EGB]|uniref:hypothetical protein n=1 Tax=Corallococcus sp. EGB TaxID=1521117 RepID=UPI00351D51DD
MALRGLARRAQADAVVAVLLRAVEQLLREGAAVDGLEVLHFHTRVATAAARAEDYHQVVVRGRVAQHLLLQLLAHLDNLRTHRRGLVLARRPRAQPRRRWTQCQTLAVEELARPRRSGALRRARQASPAQRFAAGLHDGVVERGGDKVLRKGGAGITQSDFLIINKTKAAPHVGAARA